MKIALLFAWYDLWIGLYWDKKNKWLYILPLPMIGIILKFRWVVKHKCNNMCVERFCGSDCDWHAPITKGWLKQ